MNALDAVLLGALIGTIIIGPVLGTIVGQFLAMIVFKLINFIIQRRSVT